MKPLAEVATNFISGGIIGLILLFFYYAFLFYGFLFLPDKPSQTSNNINNNWEVIIPEDDSSYKELYILDQ